MTENMFSSGHTDLTRSSDNLTPLIQTGLPYDNEQNVPRVFRSTLYSMFDPDPDPESFTTNGDRKQSSFWEAYFRDISSKSPVYGDSDSETHAYTTMQPAPHITTRESSINAPRLPSRSRSLSNRASYAIKSAKLPNDCSPIKAESNNQNESCVKSQSTDIEVSPRGMNSMSIEDDAMKATKSKETAESGIKEVKLLDCGDNTSLESQLADLAISPLNILHSAEVAVPLAEESGVHVHDGLNISKPLIKSDDFTLTHQADVSKTQTPSPSPLGSHGKSAQGGEGDTHRTTSNMWESDIWNPPSPFSTSDEHWSEIFPPAYTDQFEVERKGSITEEASQATADKRLMLKQFGYEFSSRVLTEFLGIVNFVGCASSPGEAPSASPGSVNYGTTNSSKNSQGYGRRGKGIDDFDAEEEDDEDSDENRESGRLKDSFSTDRTFACPFFQRNREKYRDERTCGGTGWKSVPRLK